MLRVLLKIFMRDENQFFSWVIQMNYLMQEQTANEQVAFI